MRRVELATKKFRVIADGIHPDNSWIQKENKHLAILRPKKPCFKCSCLEYHAWMDRMIAKLDSIYCVLLSIKKHFDSEKDLETKRRKKTNSL
jgi:hypothetical protein